MIIKDGAAGTRETGVRTSQLSGAAATQQLLRVRGESNISTSSSL